MDANGSHGNMLCMLNDNRGMPSQQTPNVGCMEVEDTEHRMPYLVFFTLRNVQVSFKASARACCCDQASHSAPDLCIVLLL